MCISNFESQTQSPDFRIEKYKQNLKPVELVDLVEQQSKINDIITKYKPKARQSKQIKDSIIS